MNRAFVFSMDAILAIVIFAVVITSFTASQNTAQVGSGLSETSDIFRVLENNGYIQEEIDANGISVAAQNIHDKAIAMLPGNRDLKVEIKQYSLDNENCRLTKTFESCFPDSSRIVSSYGSEPPLNKNIVKGRSVIIKKQEPGDCNTDYLVLEGNPGKEIEKEKGIGIILFSQLVAEFEEASDDNGTTIDFDVNTTPSSELQCGDDLTVNLTVRVVETARDPVDVIPVIDRSGSMSWTSNTSTTNHSKIWVNEGYAFAARLTSGFDDYNVLDPEHPELERTVGNDTFSDVFMLGNYAYLTDTSDDQLEIYDASTMANPSQSSTLPGFSNPQAVTALGNYAYVADSSGGLKVVNVSNKGSPSIYLNQYGVGSTTETASIGNKLFFYTSADGNFYYFDTSNAASRNYDIPIGGNVIDTYNGSSRNGYAHIGQSSGGSSTWAAQSFIPYTSSLRNFNIYVMKTGAPSGDLVVSLRSAVNGANLTSVTIPKATIGASYAWISASFPAPYAVTDTSTYYLALTTSGKDNSNYYRWGTNTANPYADGTAYQQTSVKNNNDAFLQFTDSGSTAAQSFVPDANSIQDFAVYAKRTSGIPAQPLTINLRSALDGADLATASIAAASVGSSYAWISASFASATSVTPGSTYYLVFSAAGAPLADYYLLGGSSSNPYSQGNAFRQSSTLASVDGFARQGVALTAGLQAFEISNAPYISYISSYSTTGVTDLFVDSTYAYLTLGNNGMRIVDYANASSPLLSSNLSLNGNSKGIFVTGDLAYIANDSNLYEVDVSSRSSPLITKNFRTPFGYNDVSVADGFAFLAVNSSSVSIITIDLASGEKMEVARKAARTFIDFNGWKDEDQIGLVSFSTSATTDSTLMKMTDSNRTIIKEDVNALVASGSTAVGDAMYNARTELTSSRHNAQALKFEVLMTDGLSNAGTHTPLNEATLAHDNNIVIYTVGFGPDADAATLQDIAETTDGNYYYAEDENALMEVYLLIAQEIQEATQNSETIVPIPGGATVVNGGGGEITDQNIIFTSSGVRVGNLWYGSYVLRFDCNAVANCGVSSIMVPGEGTVFQYDDKEGNRHEVPIDTNVVLVFRERNLKIDIFGGELIGQDNLLLDINVANTGMLGTGTTNFKLRLDDLNGELLSTTNVPALCGTEDSNCNENYRIFNKVPVSREGVIYAIVNEDESVYECPVDDYDAINCYGGPSTQFFAIEYSVWVK